MPERTKELLTARNNKGKRKNMAKCTQKLYAPLLTLRVRGHHNGSQPLSPHTQL